MIQYVRKSNNINLHLLDILYNIQKDYSNFEFISVLWNLKSKKGDGKVYVNDKLINISVNINNHVLQQVFEELALEIETDNCLIEPFNLMIYMRQNKISLEASYIVTIEKEIKKISLIKYIRDKLRIHF
jgi:hypothetical protein